MSHSCTVLVAPAEQLPAFTAQAGHALGELFAFADSDARKASAVIAERKPRIIAVEQQFAATPRGVALIRRIQNDPSLTHAEITLVTPDTDFARLAPPRSTPGGRRDAAATPASQYGTRRTPRFRMAKPVDVMVEGRTASVIDLSRLGAQVVAVAALKPNQRVRIALPDEPRSLRFSAVVVWALFEITPARGPQYRAGIEFIDADPSTLDPYCARRICREAFEVAARK